MSQEKPDEPEDKSSSTTNVIHRKWRTEFLSRLQTTGLHQEMVSIAYHGQYLLVNISHAV